jgi:hypothetical protein
MHSPRTERSASACCIAAVLVAAVLSQSCSFFLVHGPAAGSGAGSATECTDSDLVPAIDSAAGVLAIAGAGGGEIVTRETSDKVHDYELFYGLPLIIAGIVYFIAASRGTHRVEQCRAIKQGETTGCDGCPERVP